MKRYDKNTFDKELLRTNTNKTIHDFTIPELLDTDDELLFLLMTAISDDEERQYWFNILPIMKPDQIKLLRNILTNTISKAPVVLTNDDISLIEKSRREQQERIKQEEEQNKQDANKYLDMSNYD